MQAVYLHFIGKAKETGNNEDLLRILKRNLKRNSRVLAFICTIYMHSQPRRLSKYSGDNTTSVPMLGRASRAFIIRTDGNVANVTIDVNEDNSCEKNVKTKGVIYVVSCTLYLLPISERADESTHLQSFA